MDTFQAVYDAVRSKLSSCNVGDAVERAVRDQIIGASYAIDRIQNEMLTAIFEQQRPSVLFRPCLFIDGNAWCALYGEDLQEGVAVFGETPAEAMNDFDKNWGKPINDIPTPSSAEAVHAS